MVACVGGRRGGVTARRSIVSVISGISETTSLVVSLFKTPILVISHLPPLSHPLPLFLQTSLALALVHTHAPE